MDFDLSKLTSDQSKASETKAKPRFGPAARAVSVASREPMLSACAISTHFSCVLVQRPKPKAKPAEEPAPARESAEARPQGLRLTVDSETFLIVQKQSRNANLPSLAAQVPVRHFSLPCKAQLLRSNMLLWPQTLQFIQPTPQQQLL